MVFRRHRRKPREGALDGQRQLTQCDSECALLRGLVWCPHRPAQRHTSESRNRQILALAPDAVSKDRNERLSHKSRPRSLVVCRSPASITKLADRSFEMPYSTFSELVVSDGEKHRTQRAHNTHTHTTHTHTRTRSLFCLWSMVSNCAKPGTALLLALLMFRFA
eukprot:2992922-Amphidinium_carterae.1